MQSCSRIKHPDEIEKDSILLIFFNENLIIQHYLCFRSIYDSYIMEFVKECHTISILKQNQFPKITSWTLPNVRVFRKKWEKRSATSDRDATLMRSDTHAQGHKVDVDVVVKKVPTFWPTRWIVLHLQVQHAVFNLLKMPQKTNRIELDLMDWNWIQFFQATASHKNTATNKLNWWRWNWWGVQFSTLTVPHNNTLIQRQGMKFFPFY